MNGAVQAGLRAAAEILEIIRPQSLTSEDFGALEGSCPATKPSHGLSKPRWLLQPYKTSCLASFLRWTVGLSALVGFVFLAKKYRMAKFLQRT